MRVNGVIGGDAHLLPVGMPPGVDAIVLMGHAAGSRQLAQTVEKQSLWRRLCVVIFGSEVNAIKLLFATFIAKTIASPSVALQLRRLDDAQACLIAQHS